MYIKDFDGFDNLFFDFDGTLCESEGDLKATWRATFIERGLDLARFEAGYRTGPPTEANARSFFPEADDEFIAELCKHYRAKYYTSDYPLTVPYPGIDALLRRLKKHGKRVFMATNKNEVPLGRILNKFGWSGLFDAVLCRDMLPPGESDKAYLIRECLRERGLDPERSAMVGDTELDIRAGHHAGIAAILVTWGYGAAAELEKTEHPEYLLAFEDMQTIV